MNEAPSNNDTHQPKIRRRKQQKRKKEKIVFDGTRTRNLPLRRRMPYPLGHEDTRVLAHTLHKHIQTNRTHTTHNKRTTTQPHTHTHNKHTRANNSTPRTHNTTHTPKATPTNTIIRLSRNASPPSPSLPPHRAASPRCFASFCR